MLISELIERKRDGGELSAEELGFLLAGYLNGEMADYQMSALLMAIFFRGLTERELSTLTRAIIDSGSRLDFRDGGAPAVDKHSTGGVGDKVSLVLAPLLAEAGLRVPMMSGRGLGHTGGTLDKLESIDGFRTALNLREFREVLDEVGCAMIGQTGEIAPLDGRLYALRDVTGTVQSIPLIASSIISKKVAEGIEALVLDVKCGAGAFMAEEERALELASTLVALAETEGLRATALVTGMDEPLGRAVGNALEVREAIECLTGGGPADLREVTVALSAELLRSADPDADAAATRSRLEGILDRGSGAERLARLIRRQGGDPSVVERPDALPRARVQESFPAARAGRVAEVNARRIGLAAVELGAGRRRLGEAIDPAVGFEVLCSVGQPVERGETLAVIHAESKASAAAAAARLSGAIRIDEEAGSPPPLIRYRVTREGAERLA